MTNLDEPLESISGSLWGVIEAFLDGEKVDPHTLKQALADPAERDHFVELLLLRQAVGSAASLGSTTTARGAMTARGGMRLRWFAAAAAIVFGVTAGYFAGQRVSANHDVTVETSIESGTPAAPPPTRVIRLQPGMNWTDTPEGH